MGICITQAGEALIASLQAQGLPLVIDTMIFANVPGLDPALAADRAQTVPTEDVVHSADIPAEYRAFVNPNQVVYSVLLGSDVGDFTFNWQGLYCSAHQTLIAVAELPSIEKRANDEGTNTPGNNLTRNFMLQFTGAQALTGLTVAAEVWQLDFTVRLKGIDERERLSNRDIYGRDAFLGDGWLLVNAAGTYHFEPGTGYVEGIRAALEAQLPAVPAPLPCDVYLDVCLAPQGSDVVTLVAPRFVAAGAGLPDYAEGAPFHTPHYCAQVAHVAADGTVTDLRPKGALLINESTDDHNTDPEAHREFATPPQFDTSTKPATMEALQRALGNVRGYKSLGGSGALTNADAGKTIILASATAIIVTLPAAATVPAGSRLHFVNIGGSGNSTVTCAAGDGILAKDANALASLVLAPGDSLTLESLNGTKWYAVGGSAQLGYAGVFSASLGLSGRRRLPSGDLEQWGYNFATGVPTAVTFPVAFSEIYGIEIGLNSAVSVNGSVTINSMATTGFTFTGWIAGVQSSNSTLAIYWRAIGK